MEEVTEPSQFLFRNLSITISLLLVLTHAISRVTFPKMSSAIYNFSRFFNFRIKDEFGSNIRLLSTESFYFTMILSASISFVILNILFSQAYLPQQLTWLLPQSYGAGILIWLLMSIAIQLAFLLKYGFYSLVGYLFNLPLSISRHFQETQSLNNCFVLILMVVCSLVIYSSYQFPLTVANGLMVGVGIYLLYRLLNVYVKLEQLKVYSKLYIFSYLCTTEILPTLIGIKLLAY